LCLLAQETLCKAIDDKKTAAAAEARRQQQQEQAEREAAQGAPASATVVNVYGDRVPVRPHISPRTKRLAREHLAGEAFAGNYGQRLYQYGVTDFQKVRPLRSRRRQRPSVLTRLPSSWNACLRACAH
jgi:hypothetical protein